MRKLAAACLLLLVIQGSAAAHTTTVLDGDDSPGPLDAVAARHRDLRDDRTIRLKLVTYETWTYKAISGNVWNFITFEIDLDRDDVADRCAVVRAHTPTDGAALGYSVVVYRECTYFLDEVIAEYGMDNIEIPDAHSIAVEVPRRVLVGKRADSYRWRAVTSHQDDQDGEGSCPPPNPHGDGGYGTCTDVTAWKRHRT